MTATSGAGGLRRSLGAIALTAVCFALVTGVAEAAVKGTRLFVFHRIVWVSRDWIWMTPLAYVVFFLGCAVVLAAAALLTRRAVPLSWTVATFGFLGVFAWLLPFGQLAPWASAVLAAGVGMQLGRLAARAPERWLRAFRTLVVVLGAGVTTAAVGLRGWRAVAERRALAAAVGDPASPNILIIVLDTVRRASLGLYGYARPTTPALERWALGGVVFDRAVAPSPWTLPSHGSLFSGRSAGEVGGDWTVPISAEPRMIAEVLRARGYVTGGLVANLLYTSHESGLARGFTHYDDYPVSARLVLMHASFGRTRLVTKLMNAQTLRDAARAVREFDFGPSRVPADVYRPGEAVTDAFLAWQQATGERPFFAFLNYFDAHWPRSPEPWDTLFGGEARRRRDRYDGAIAYLDHEVGRLLDSLQRRGVLDRTIVMVAGDHGEQFGEHGLSGHANSLYLPLIEVPLILRYPPGVPAGQRIGALVTLRDVAATMLDLAGVPNEGVLPGRSLARYWRGPAGAEASDVIAEVSRSAERDSTLPNFHGPMVSRLDERLHYIRDGRGGEELYAYRSDSLELVNLANDTLWQADLVRMRRGLDALAPRKDAAQRR